MFTLAEWELFNELVKKDSKKIFEIAVAGYINGISSQPLVVAMRQNKVEELFVSLPKIEEQDDQFQKMYKLEEIGLIEMLVNSYNKPEPNIPMSLYDIEEQIKDTVKSKKL